MQASQSATGVSRALPGPKCPGSVPRGVSGALRAPASGASKKCPQSVPRVSKRCPDTPGTLSGHFLAPEAGARRAPETPRETLPDTSGPKGPRDSCLETNLASHWEGVRLPRASGSPRTSPEVPRTSLEVFGDFPGSSLTVELNSNPEVPRKFPRLPRKFPRTSPEVPGLPRRSAVSLGSLTPSSDSHKLSLTCSRPGG